MIDTFQNHKFFRLISSSVYLTTFVYRDDIVCVTMNYEPWDFDFLRFREHVVDFVHVIDECLRERAFLVFPHAAFARLLIAELRFCEFLRVDHSRKGNQQADALVFYCRENANSPAHAMTCVANPVEAFVLRYVDDRLEVLHFFRNRAVLEAALRLTVTGKRESQRTDTGFLKSFRQPDRPGTILVTSHS